MRNAGVKNSPTKQVAGQDAEHSRIAGKSSPQKITIFLFWQTSGGDHSEKETRCRCRRVTATFALNDGGDAAAGTFEKAAVITHHQVGVDLLHQVEGDTDRDQQTRTAVETGDGVRNAK